MTFKGILEEFRSKSFSEKEKGTQFERLIQRGFAPTPGIPNSLRFGFGRIFLPEKTSEARI